MIGRTIGKYRIVGQLGRGGAGIVYCAVDETLHRDVAIKVLDPALANSEAMKRFRAEATILARLNHPQIATIYELFQSDTDLLMVMELVRGETLDGVAGRGGPMEPDAAAFVADQILAALEHAHRAGIVHRDMKPANVMVTDSGAIKIMDFGIARVRDAEQKTIDGRLMGTPGYMPPEQLLGQEVDARADLYSVGVLFYRLLSGAMPFAADTAVEMLQRQIRDVPTELRFHDANLPSWCEAIVQRALARSPADRFQSAAEFRGALERGIGHATTTDLVRALVASTRAGARPAGAPTVVQTNPLGSLNSPDEPAATPEPAAAPHVTRARFPWRHALAAAAAAVAIATAAYVALRPDAAAAGVETTTSGAAAPAVLAAPPVEAAVSAPTDSPAPAAAPPEAVRAAPRTARATPAATEPSTPQPESSARIPEPRVSSRKATSPPRGRERALTSLMVEAPLVFDTRTLVGTKKAKEHEGQLILAEGRITVTTIDPEVQSPLYTIPYSSVLSIAHSHGRDPLWNGPRGPTAVARGGGTLGRLGIIVERDWISIRTNTKDQFVAMRFEELLVSRVLLALEERTGRTPELIRKTGDNP
jgi:serine/threonine-protein kinase